MRYATDEGAHALLDDAFDIQCEERTLIQRYAAGSDEMTDLFMPRFEPMVMARRALEPEGRWDESSARTGSSRVAGTRARTATRRFRLPTWWSRGTRKA